MEKTPENILLRFEKEYLDLEYLSVKITNNKKSYAVTKKFKDNVYKNLLKLVDKNLVNFDTLNETIDAIRASMIIVLLEIKPSIDEDILREDTEIISELLITDKFVNDIKKHLG